MDRADQCQGGVVQDNINPSPPCASQFFRQPAYISGVTYVSTDEARLPRRAELGVDAVSSTFPSERVNFGDSDARPQPNQGAGRLKANPSPGTGDHSNLATQTALLEVSGTD